MNEIHEAYSAALCRGLIEAHSGTTLVHSGQVWYSAALCRGLIEACTSTRMTTKRRMVFRGFMPRPH